ncbi:DNA topoisomerase 6 subunit B [Arachis hypogaea]|nr:DNA topoisomerase 6 subunit B [Arachis hypogaea]
MPSFPHHSPTLASSRIQNPNQKPSLFNGFDAAVHHCRRLRGLLLPLFQTKSLAQHVVVASSSSFAVRGFEFEMLAVVSSSSSCSQLKVRVIICSGTESAISLPDGKVSSPHPPLDSMSPEFFAENKNIAGFDNPGKSLYTTVRKLVENSLDSAESISELPVVEITIEEIKKSKFNSMIGLIDCGRVVVQLTLTETASMLRKKPMIRKTRLSRKDSMDYLYQPVSTIPCIATLRSYEEEFPPLVTQTDEKKITRRPYVIPQGITPHGHQATTPQEEVLNWHTDNAVSQNKVLLWIDHTLDALVEKTEGLSAQLDKRIKEGSPAPGRSINTLTLNKSRSEKITDESDLDEETTESSEETAEWSEEDYEANLSAIAMVNPVEEEEEEVIFERDEPATSANPAPAGSFKVKTPNKWFTFDDIPLARYRERLNEFSAWIETTMANPNLSSTQVLADFINRMTGNL